MKLSGVVYHPLLFCRDARWDDSNCVSSNSNFRTNRSRSRVPSNLFVVSLPPSPSPAPYQPIHFTLTTTEKWAEKKKKEEGNSLHFQSGLWLIRVCRLLPFLYGRTNSRVENLIFSWFLCNFSFLPTFFAACFLHEDLLEFGCTFSRWTWTVDNLIIRCSIAW